MPSVAAFTIRPMTDASGQQRDQGLAIFPSIRICWPKSWQRRRRRIRWIPIDLDDAADDSLEAARDLR